jgi:uncharacterized protein (DUF433 family)
MNWPIVDGITVNPNQCDGQPCVRGMRIPVCTILRALAHFERVDVLRQYPMLTESDLARCLLYAAEVFKPKRSE